MNRITDEDTMRSYIKFLSRNKLYTVIEAMGLAVSLAMSLAVSLAFVVLIGTYVWQQYKVAYENPDYYRVYAVVAKGGNYWTGYFDKGDIDASIPEVEVSIRYMGDESQETAVTVNGETHLISAAFFDKEFFEVFPYYDMVEGTADVLDDPSNVIVSRRFANTISIDGGSVVGMQLRYPDDHEKVFTIAGVMEDFGKTIFKYSDVFSICVRRDWKRAATIPSAMS